ncbi:hypothetical protein [Bradyrhizobium sp. AUGA SZCCT0182]|nr:hypothetical protein [Bradyrhizobium sp. AUGA SZCCT0182]
MKEEMVSQNAYAEGRCLLTNNKERIRDIGSSIKMAKAIQKSRE